jgi:predicted XRE-type DNA-binding protein
MTIVAIQPLFLNFRKKIAEVPTNSNGMKYYIKDNDLTQEQAAKLMGVSRPRISDVVRGKIDKFTIDALVDILTKVGHHVVITVKKAA